MRTPFRLLLTALLLLVPLSGARADDEEPIVVEDGRTVSVEYTLKLDDGTTADSNVGEEPLVYEQGASKILPAFEKQLAGMKVDESRDFVLSPEQGYGPADPELRQEVSADQIPEEARHAGAQLVSEDRAGHRRLVRVSEVHDEVVVLDLNHPLAGQNLHFHVKVVGIQ